MKGGALLGGLALVLLGAVVGSYAGWRFAAARGEAHAAELGAVVASQGVQLDAASHALATVSQAAGSWADSVHVLVAKIRAQRRAAAAPIAPNRPTGSPPGDSLGADTLPPPVGPDLTEDLLGACDQAATSCQAMRDSAARLDTLAHVQHDSIATLLALPQPVAPKPITISVGRFKAGAAVGAGGATLLLVSLYLLLHH